MVKIALKKNETKTILHEEFKDAEIVLSKGSSLTFVLLPQYFNGLNHYTNVNVEFRGEGSIAKILGIYIGKDKEKIEITTNAVHKAQNTKCKTDIRGVLKEASFSNYTGKITIDKKAQKTNSFLDDKVLLLGDKAKSENTPLLEIETDDVKASHSATVGKVSDDDIFYLMSRGLSRQEAERLIVEGFFEPIIEQIEDEKVAGLVRVKVGQRLR